MAIISLICQQCGGHVELDDTREYGFCKFCKVKIVIKSDTIVNEITQNVTKHVYGQEGKDVEELVADGNRLLALGDDKKANAKFRQAISVESDNWDAWFGYAATGGDRSEHISCVPAYRNAYNLATEESQEIITFSDMVCYIPDGHLGDALVKAYKAAPINKRHEMFDLVSGVIGCDESEIAMLVIDLCPNDWRAWFAQAKIRQLRVRWCDRRLERDAMDVLNIFLRAYQLAKYESSAARTEVLSYISSLERDDSYKNFLRELNNRIRREG